ncbi:MAG TPA: two-component regulator propeller domain-containing protein, partial [Candidatus Krumholzibacterium sp.]|nr:two-component regulator propeller domain-containing protein [Candidatus Krumholzibacterium sp.]
MDKSHPKRSIRLCMVMAAAILASFDLTAQPAPELVATFLGTGSGMPNNTVRAIARTGDGYLWLATGAGLTRTDGVNFLVFDRFNTPSLGCNGILSLYLDDNDLLWAGTDGCGLHIYNGSELEPSAVNEYLEDGRVRAIAGDLQGRLWIGTERGLYCHDGERS